jgi:hypothetical protein
VCWLGLLVALSLASLSPGRTGEPPAREIDDLIRKLGDGQHAVREAATRRLLELEGVVPALRTAQMSQNAEIAKRAAWILEERRRRPGQRALARLKQHVKNGEIDQAVELLVARAKWEGENACWQALTGLAADLIERGRKEFGEVIPPPDRLLPVGDFDRYLKDCHPVFMVGSRVNPEGKRAGQGEGSVLRGKDMLIQRGEGCGGLIACAGNLHVTSKNQLCDLSHCVVYATGSVAMKRLHNSLLVCDGDLKALTIVNSLVIVRGDVYCADNGGVGNSLVIMTGRFHLGKRESRIGKKADLREQKPDLLGFVKFFDLAQAGVEVEAVKGGVRVKALDANKALAKAGLRVGDTVTAVDEQGFLGPDTFRRQLRSALARDSFTLQVSRGGQNRQIRIPPAQP